MRSILALFTANRIQVPDSREERAPSWGLVWAWTSPSCSSRRAYREST